MPLQQFIFDGERETPQELARRRAIAESMLQRGTGGIASNMGEGIAQFGQALAGRIGASMADAKLRKNQGAARKGMGSLFDSGGGMPSVAPDVLAGGASPSPAPRKISASRLK